ncbi:MAG TPA: 4-(cytidine 5'-diphospho)-2-C-methyl-D-erythritol kinase [Acidimicrobiales bacterium]|nr:4-(cytidine 5'-diphospho)-2-C-methyl-D-erythritol kinase [Acidimicrobiales bacterium]
MTVVSAHAKLTGELRITGVRDDGFHLIDAEMMTLDLADELTILPGDSLEVDRVGGADIPSGADNLVSRALRAVDRVAAVRISKHIPAGGGLGGGSADAAAILRWAGCGDLDIAVSIGADVPFCLVGGRARVRGIGELVEPLAFVDRTFTLALPGLHCSTPAVYAAWDELGGPTADGPNDLEPAALKVVPALAQWRDDLGDATGETPVLAGSGSTWFVEGDHPGDGRLVVHTVPASIAGNR